MHSLTQLFFTEWTGEEPGNAADLERTLRAVLEEGRRAWPRLSLSPEKLIAGVARRLPAAAAPWEPLAALHAEDLYLACACEHCCPAALAAFEERFMARVPGYLAKRSLSAAVLDEVTQRLRAKLFVAAPGQRPKIADYSGRGSLEGWLRVRANRMALEHLRDERRREKPAALQSSLPVAAPPELAHIESRYRSERQRSIRRAWVERWKVSPDECGDLLAVVRSVQGTTLTSLLRSR